MLRSIGSMGTLALLAQTVAAQECSIPSSRTTVEDSLYFDFWPGAWYAVQNGKREPVPAFLITRSVHDAAFREEWRQVVDGAVLRSTALRSWDTSTQRWQFVWISDQGHYQIWDGVKNGPHWYIQRTFTTGTEVFWSRQAWIPLADGKVVRVLERSHDRGSTWQPRYCNVYERGPLLADVGDSAVTSRPFGRADSTAVYALSHEYGRAWLANDTAAIMRLFAPDAVLIPHLGNPQVKGLAAIRNHFWPPDARPAPVIQFDRETLEIRGHGGVAWDRGTYRLAFVYQGDTIRNAGNYLAVSERSREGNWRWVSYIWNHR